jgi:CheY-like chemotaxis protein
MDILLVEDNPGDARLAQEAWKEGGIPARMHVVSDGVEAIDYLRGSEFRTPDLLLLDLNLPRKDGREVLREIKADPKLRRIPVVVLTTSQAVPDIMHSYDLHANCFVTKPVDLDSFILVMKSIAEFWGRVVSLPPH